MCSVVHVYVLSFEPIHRVEGYERNKIRSLFPSVASRRLYRYAIFVRRVVQLGKLHPSLYLLDQNRPFSASRRWGEIIVNAPNLSMSDRLGAFTLSAMEEFFQYLHTL